MEEEDSVGNLDLESQVEKLLEIPSIDESRKYFSKICEEKGWAVEVKSDEEGGKGKGLYATKDFCSGDVIILEAPLVAAQEQESRPDCVVCSQCFRHIGGVGYQLSWWLMNHEQGDKESQEIRRALMDGTLCVPFSEYFEKDPPVMCPSNCGDIYCSTECQSQAWKDHHRFLCMFADDQEISIPVNRDALKELENISLQTNSNLLMAAKVIAIVLIRALNLLKEKCTDLAAVGHEECWLALLDAWRPLRHAWKVIWWENVAPPPDVTDKDGFIDDMRDLITDTSEVLEDAFQVSHMFPALFHTKVIASIMGMFEQNNIGIDVPSPLELYLDNLDQTQHKSLQSMGVMRDLIAEAAECPLQGTGYYPVACCANHSCAPNAVAAYRSDEDDGGHVCMVAAHDIKAGDEIYISYIDLSLSREERGKELEDYGFSCNCELCEEEKTYAGD